MVPAITSLYLLLYLLSLARSLSLFHTEALKQVYRRSSLYISLRTLTSSYLPSAFDLVL